MDDSPNRFDINALFTLPGEPTIEASGVAVYECDEGVTLVVACVEYGVRAVMCNFGKSEHPEILSTMQADLVDSSINPQPVMFIVENGPAPTILLTCAEGFIVTVNGTVVQNIVTRGFVALGAAFKVLCSGQSSYTISVDYPCHGILDSGTDCVVNVQVSCELNKVCFNVSYGINDVRTKCFLLPGIEAQVGSIQQVVHIANNTFALLGTNTVPGVDNYAHVNINLFTVNPGSEDEPVTLGKMATLNVLSSFKVSGIVATCVRYPKGMLGIDASLCGYDHDRHEMFTQCAFTLVVGDELTGELIFRKESTAGADTFFGSGPDAAVVVRRITKHPGSVLLITGNREIELNWGEEKISWITGVRMSDVNRTVTIAYQDKNSEHKRIQLSVDMSQCARLPDQPILAQFCTSKFTKKPSSGGSILLMIIGLVGYAMLGALILFAL